MSQILVDKKLWGAENLPARKGKDFFFSKNSDSQNQFGVFWWQLYVDFSLEEHECCKCTKKKKDWGDGAELEKIWSFSFVNPTLLPEKKYRYFRRSFFGEHKKRRVFSHSFETKKKKMLQNCTGRCEICVVRRLSFLWQKRWYCLASR